MLLWHFFSAEILFTRYFAFEKCASNLENWAWVSEQQYHGEMPSDRNGLLQMASALSYLHENGYAHGVICPRNILISIGGEKLIISDFGLTNSLNSDSRNTTKTGRPSDWLAPERINNPKQRSTFQSDIWAIGCTFFYFLTKGAHPFHDDNPLQLQTNIVRGTANTQEMASKFLDESYAEWIQLLHPTTCILAELTAKHEGYKQLVERMTNNHADQRPAMKEVKKEIADIVASPSDPVLVSDAPPSESKQSKKHWLVTCTE